MKVLWNELCYPLGIALAIFVVLLLFGCKYEFIKPHGNPCTADRGNCYSIQGEYSHLGCPGQYVTTLEIDNHVFFLSCYGTRDST